GRGDPQNHVAMNVALYGKPGRWAMTERGRAALRRDATTLTIGQSAMRWDGAALRIALAETTVPRPTKLRGEVVVRPRGLTGVGFTLDEASRHRWRPLAPLCDVEVRFEAPALGWRGTGYFDTNEGDEPLEVGFLDWTWTRFDAGDGARIFYDVVQRDGAKRGLALAVDDGRVTPTDAIAYQPLPKTGWGVSRAVPCELAGTPTLVRTLENAPFYARSEVRALIGGREMSGVHETLSLPRLVHPAVRFMVPFRMPRW
ncbi:MAG: carotenoid 1,2-hydratase, partial [Caulobacteraceae bacterium]|nr:carotenoid 1,2-hydratase [Caulobacter sp.]